MVDKSTNDAARAAETAKLEQLRGEITQAVTPQIKALQKAFIANKAYHKEHPEDHKTQPQFLEAVDRLQNAVADAIKAHGISDAPYAHNRNTDVTPGLMFEASIVDAALAPLRTPQAGTSKRTMK